MKRVAKNIKIGDVFPGWFNDIILRARYKNKPINKIKRIEIDFELE